MIDQAKPCLVLRRVGEPEIYYWPKVPLNVGDEVVTPDALVAARDGERTVWILVEIDEDPVVSVESIRRERMLALPTIRITAADLMRTDFMDRFLERVKGLLERAA